MIITTSAPSLSKAVIKHENENRFKGFKNNFLSNNNEVDNSIVNNEKFGSFFHKETDLFYCNSKDNHINGLECLIENEICANCQRLNQKYHKLKPNYLINRAGRVCTYRKGKMFCLGKFQRVKKEAAIREKGKESEIAYIINLTCNGKIQCKPCETMQQFMKQYYSHEMYEQLMKRDAQFGY